MCNPKHLFSLIDEFVNLNEDLAKKGLSNELEVAITQFARSNTFTLVGTKPVKQAQLIIEFYNKNFLCLGGIELSISETLEEILKSMSNKRDKVTTTTTEKFDEDTRKHIRNALISPGKFVD